MADKRTAEETALLLLSSDWLISIQNGAHAYCRGNSSFWCCLLIGSFRSKMAAAPAAETAHPELKQSEFYSVWRNCVQTQDSCL